MELPAQPSGLPVQPGSTPAPLPIALTPGQVLSARVIEVLSADTFLLAVRGRTLVAASPTPLTPDTIVQLAVQAAGDADTPVAVKLLATTATIPKPGNASPDTRLAEVVRELGLPPGEASELTVAAFTRLGVPLADPRAGGRTQSSLPLRQAVSLVQAAIIAELAPLETSLPDTDLAAPTSESTTTTEPTAESTTSRTATQTRQPARGQAQLVPRTHVPGPVVAQAPSTRLTNVSNASAMHVVAELATPSLTEQPVASTAMPAIRSVSTAPAAPLTTVAPPASTPTPSARSPLSPTAAAPSTGPTARQAPAGTPAGQSTESVRQSAPTTPNVIATTPVVTTAPQARNLPIVQPDQQRPALVAPATTDPLHTSEPPAARGTQVVVQPTTATHAPPEQPVATPMTPRMSRTIAAYTAAAPLVTPRAAAPVATTPIPAEPSVASPASPSAARVATAPVIATPPTVLSAPPSQTTAPRPPSRTTPVTGPLAPVAAVTRHEIPPAARPMTATTAAPRSIALRTWTAEALQARVPDARPADLATATARLARSPLPLTPVTVALALRAPGTALPAIANRLPPEIAHTVDLAAGDPPQVIRNALQLAGVMPAGEARNQQTALQQLIRLVVLAGATTSDAVRLTGAGAGRQTDAASSTGKSAAESPNTTAPAEPGVSRSPVTPGVVPAALHDASEARATSTANTPSPLPAAAEPAMAAVREAAAEHLLPPTHLDDYDRVMALPLMVAGQPLPARLAVTTRRTADGGMACWLRVDCALSRLGDVSVRLSGADGGPVAVTLVAAPAAAADLAAALPALTADLHAKGVVAALRVVSQEPA